MSVARRRTGWGFAGLKVRSRQSTRTGSGSRTIVRFLREGATVRCGRGAHLSVESSRDAYKGVCLCERTLGFDFEGEVVDFDEPQRPEFEGFRGRGSRNRSPLVVDTRRLHDMYVDHEYNRFHPIPIVARVSKVRDESGGTVATYC